MHLIYYINRKIDSTFWALNQQHITYNLVATDGCESVTSGLLSQPLNRLRYTCRHLINCGTVLSYTPLT